MSRILFKKNDSRLNSLAKLWSCRFKNTSFSGLRLSKKFKHERSSPQKQQKNLFRNLWNSRCYTDGDGRMLGCVTPICATLAAIDLQKRHMLFVFWTKTVFLLLRMASPFNTVYPENVWHIVPHFAHNLFAPDLQSISTALPSLLRTNVGSDILEICWIN